MSHWQKRRTIKTAREILRLAKHLRNTREDLMSEAELKTLGEAEKRLRKALKAGDMTTVESTGNALYSCIGKLTPARSHPALREHVEIVVVAIVVAMGFRMYFVQPFKIPTGSMQPTLYGITSRYQSRPFFMDKWPMKAVKWFGAGEWYRNVTVKTPGVLERIVSVSNDPSNLHYYIAGIRYRIPKDAHRRQEVRHMREEEYISAGTVLWSGIIMSGDHVFVDKMRWNFWKPKRGQIMVFNTDDIIMDPPVSLGTHYIKRMVGLPNERISIDPPNLRINGTIMLDPPQIARIAKNPGYKTIDPRERGQTTSRVPLISRRDVLTLAGNEYFALGDNTSSSKDGRYWGAVRRKSLTGPAWLIYWPFIKWDPYTGRRSLHFGRTD